MAKLNLSNIGPMNNVIINGDFDIWQRGTSYAAIPTGTLLADRWALQHSSEAVFTVSRNTGVPTGSAHISNYSLAITATTGDASIGASQFTAVSYTIEGYDFHPIMGKSVTLSFWVFASVTGVYSVALRNASASHSLVSEYTVSSAATWEKKEITIAVPDSSVGTWETENLAGCSLWFTIACGTTFQTSTVGSLVAGNYIASDNQVNGIASNGNVTVFSQVKLEVGQIATPFVPRPFAEELALCQRYYEKSFAQGTTPAQNIGSYTGALVSNAFAATTQIELPLTFKVTKRAAPSVTTYNPVAANALIRNLAAINDFSTTVVSNIGDNALSIYGTTSTITSLGNLCAVHWTADAEI